MDEFYKLVSEEIITKLGLDSQEQVTVIKSKQIDLRVVDYIYSIIYTYSAEDARKLLNVSEDTIRRFTKKYLRDKFPEWSPGKHWHIILMNYVGFRRCNNCDISYTLDQDMFGKDKNRPYGLSRTCRSCDATRGKLHRDCNREYYREHARNYYHANKEYFLFYTSLRRSRELQACPSWANLDKIKNIYLNKPNIDTQIDHIIPLKNRWVCGLHVDNNLQYLSAEDNRRKSNKFDIEEFNQKYYNS
jgi:hypothetical protein